uniref:G-protein coupled receptors family 1 profile domain-containing protein n=1 Tax=Romanomermis culicivorax TaxID=13658 RepID=A0A915HZT4_ROMCU
PAQKLTKQLPVEQDGVPEVPFLARPTTKTAYLRHYAKLQCKANVSLDFDFNANSCSVAMFYPINQTQPNYDFATEIDRFWVNNLVFFVSMGPVAAAANFFVVYLIIGHKKHHTSRFYLFLAAFFLARMFQSLYIFCYGIFQVVGAKLRFLYMRKIYCLLVYTVPYFCECSATWIICLIAVDRLLAISLPFKYRLFSTRSGYIGLTLIYCLCALQVTSGVLLELWSAGDYHVMCRSITLVIKSDYSFAIMYINVVSGIFSVATYICILVLAKLKIRKKTLFIQCSRHPIAQENHRVDINSIKCQKQAIAAAAKLASSVRLLILLYSMNVILIPLLRLILSQFYVLTLKADQKKIENGTQSTKKAETKHELCRLFFQTIFLGIDLHVVHFSLLDTDHTRALGHLSYA